MIFKTLDETTVKYFIGEKFRFFSATENFLYENGKRTDKKEGIKVKIYSEVNPDVFLFVKVNGTMDDIAGFKIHDSIDFENLTGKFWIKETGKRPTQEISLKADGIKFLLAK